MVQSRAMPRAPRLPIYLLVVGAGLAALPLQLPIYDRAFSLLVSG